MNERKLLSVMAENGDTQTALADAIGISRTRLCMKIHGKRGASFTQPEILAIKQRYSLTGEKVDEIFFS